MMTLSDKQFVCVVELCTLQSARVAIFYFYVTPRLSQFVAVKSF